jgi:hypothetical protein
MSVLTEPGPKFSSIDYAKQLQLSFDAAHLRIRDVQARFNSRALDTTDDADARRGTGSISKTPDALAAEVLDYMVRSLHLSTLQYFTIFPVFHE